MLLPNLFSPIKVGHLEVKNRVVMAPLDVDSAITLDAEYALELLSGLSPTARLAILLIHAPDRIQDDDLSRLQVNPKKEPVVHPSRPLDREETSRLIWPPEIPETQSSRRLRLERIRKVLKRAYEQLAKAMRH